jgi:hypothetical protein
MFLNLSCCVRYCYSSVGNIVILRMLPCLWLLLRASTIAWALVNMYMKPVCYPGFTFPPVTEQTEACGLFSDSSRLEPHPVHRLCLRKLPVVILSFYRKVLDYCLTLGHGRLFPRLLLFIISQLTLCMCIGLLAGPD